LIAYAVSTTGQAASLAWDRTDLRIQGNSVEMSECRQVPIGDGLSLPARSVYLPLAAGQELTDIEYCNDADFELGLNVPIASLNDGVTADGDRYAAVVSEHNSSGRLGFSPVEIIGRIVIDGVAYAELLVFPVTVDQNGRTWFHADVDLALKGRQVVSAELIDREDLPRLDRTIRSAASSTGPEYLIITSVALSDAFQPLVDYKNETGYVTELAYIDDILTTSTGVDDAEKLRNYLKDRYAEGLRYVLLAGDETVVPIRYAYPNSASEMPSLEMQQICDLYFADLTGEWDSDGDGIWGEAYVDQADLTPELRVGRLPINSVEEAANYVAKLIRYETDPGDGDRSYLERTFFYASDQMRDYGAMGQHGAIASAFPSRFEVDTVSAVEISSGDDPAPSNGHPGDLSALLLDGFGIYNVIAHGRYDGFVFTSSGYNNWPKTYMLTDGISTGHGEFSSIDNESRPAFYYSLGCDNGGFDMDQPPLNYQTPNMAQELIGSPGGAVAMVAYSRWGWISASYLLQEAFFDTLFAHPDRPAFDALTGSKATLYYYRDLMYGLNYLGDPTLKIYGRLPDKPEIKLGLAAAGLEVTVTVDGNPSMGADLVLSENGRLLARYYTGVEGKALVDYPISDDGRYKLSVMKPGATVTQTGFIPGLITGTEDDQSSILPVAFALHQNYPNPFNPTTTISFDIPERSHVELTVYNLLGQALAHPLDIELPAGSHEVAWDGRDSDGNPVASGIYFYRLQAADYSDVRKMVLLK
jgi:hypothetical protein